MMGARNLLLAAALAALLAFGAAGVVDAGDGNQGRMSEQEAIRGALKRGEVLPLTRIIAIAVAEVPGDVIEVELEREDGVIVYEIKVLTARGRVREVYLDARTGSIVKIEND